LRAQGLISLEKDKIMRIWLAFAAGTAALSVSACAADGVYGSGGLAYGYGDGSPYGYSCYGGSYGYGYGYSPYGDCGWYDGFFYPGFGNFVFDRHHHRHEMTMSQHDHFTRQARGADGNRRVGLGSSGGVVPPGVSQPQHMSGGGRAGGGSHFGGGRGGFSGGGHGGGGGRSH
jgi:hypothetical protein